jgi:2-polyprenyl-3-methyl-5-hydroxy-6-metoxy-1,4-benzoquinol methylase
MVRCRGCTLVHMNPRPDAADLARLYGEAYYAGHAEFSYADEREPRHEPRVRVKAAGRLARVEATLASRGVVTRRVVELGCSYGVFLDEARKRGWTVTGVDVSADAAAWVREHRGIDVRVADLADAGLAPASADLVTGSEVVEHLADPVRTARAAFDLVAPGGVVLFSTANENSLARRLRGAAWGYFMPGHVVVWSAATLTRLLETAGFAGVRVTAGDERGLANHRAARRAGDPVSVAGWLARRVRVGGFTVGAGMIVEGRRP